eukprot:scaffold697_cov235-Pinguiococcus_pyrenoidosus.AAC.4
MKCPRADRLPKSRRTDRSVSLSPEPNSNAVSAPSASQAPSKPFSIALHASASEAMESNGWVGIQLETRCATSTKRAFVSTSTWLSRGQPPPMGGEVASSSSGTSLDDCLRQAEGRGPFWGRLPCMVAVLQSEMRKGSCFVQTSSAANPRNPLPKRAESTRVEATSRGVYLGLGLRSKVAVGVGACRPSRSNCVFAGPSDTHMKWPLGARARTRPLPSTAP